MREQQKRHTDDTKRASADERLPHPDGGTAGRPDNHAASWNGQSLPNPYRRFHHGQISPDGKWIAYLRSEPGGGGTQVYVRRFPSGEGKWQVSTIGGAEAPRWSGDGRELFFLSAIENGKLMASEIRPTGSSLQVSAPRELFDSGYFNFPGDFHKHPYAVSPDGQRFLIPRPQ
jgi:hypothetical protein